MSLDLAASKPVQRPDEETARLAALNAYRILDTPPEEPFDRIARLAVLTLDVPIALISMVGSDRHWFKACCGIDIAEMPRAIAFCDYAVREPDVMVVGDATKDPRFASNPLVTGQLNLRFYAGVPLIDPQGMVLGTLCVLDRAPREFGPREKFVLQEFGAQVMHELTTRAKLGARYANAELPMERELAQAELRTQLEALLNATGSAALTFDPAGAIQSWNAAAEAIFGYTSEAAVGRPISDILPHLFHRRQGAEDATGMSAAWLCAHDPAGSPALTIGRHRSGRPFPVDSTFAAWRTPGGEQRAGAILQDSTERRRIEEELRRSRTHLDEAQRIGGIGSWDWTIATGDIKLSDAMCQLLNLPVGTRRTPADALSVIHPDDRGAWQEAMDRMIAGEHTAPVTYRMVKPDGTQRVFQSLGRLVQSHDGAHLIGVLRDVTEQTRQEAERSRQEEDLKRSQMHLSEAQRIGGIGSWDWHLPSDRIRPSQEMYNLLGIPPGTPRTSADVLRTMNPDDHAAWRAQIERASAGEQVEPVSYRMSRPDGSIRIFQSIGQLVHYTDGPHLVGIIRDITDQTRHEAERRETEKLAALGHLAGGVAHEINNLLQPIMSLSDLAREDVAAIDDDTLRTEMNQNLGIIIQCARDAREIVRKILRFARQEEPTLTETSLADALNDTVALVRPLLSPGIGVTVDLAPDADGAARINPAEMTQVVTNLAINADHAMKGQGRLSFALETATFDETEARPATLAPGAYFLLRVSDTGCGMDAETAARIFDPFFTTKPVGKGTGLGLSMVHGILSSWKGAITVESEPGQGTEFRLYIPVAGRQQSG